MNKRVRVLLLNNDRDVFFSGDVTKSLHMDILTLNIFFSSAGLKGFLRIFALESREKHM